MTLIPTIIHTPALPIVSPLFGAMIPTLIPLGSSNILLPPQTIYQLAFNLALEQLHRERAQQSFRHHQHPSNN